MWNLMFYSPIQIIYRRPNERHCDEADIATPLGEDVKLMHVKGTTWMKVIQF
jgi:hypothetical protein